MKALFFLLLVSFSFAVGDPVTGPNNTMSSSSFNLTMNLNSGGNISNSTNYVLDADIGSLVFYGTANSTNFNLTLTTSIQAQSAAPAEEPAPPEPPAPTMPSASDSTDALGIASPNLDVSSLNSSSSYAFSLRVGSQQFASHSLHFSSGVASIVFNTQITPAYSGKTVTVQVS